MYGKGSITSNAINQHREMAGAGSKGNFGVGKLPQRDKQHPDVGMSHAAMDDAKRGPGLGGSGMAKQAAPDHGQMGADHFNRYGKA